MLTFQEATDSIEEVEVPIYKKGHWKFFQCPFLFTSPASSASPNDICENLPTLNGKNNIRVILKQYMRVIYSTHMGVIVSKKYIIRRE